MSKRVFVAITTGKQGRTLSSELLCRGYSVISLTHNPRSTPAVQLSELGVDEVGYNVDMGALQSYHFRLRPMYEALTKQQLGW